MTRFSDDEHILACIRAGAAGYTLKDTPPRNIVQQVLELHPGAAPTSAKIARKLIELTRNEPQPQRKASKR